MSFVIELSRIRLVFDDKVFFRVQYREVAKNVFLESLRNKWQQLIAYLQDKL